jgi:hypothetical protein
MALHANGNERKGSLGTIDATGSTSEINADAFPFAAQLTFLCDESVGGNTSSQAEQSIDGGTTWVAVGSAVTAAAAVIAITNPVGLYRVTVTVTGGSCIVKWQFGPFYTSD